MIFDRQILFCITRRTFALLLSAGTFFADARAQEFDPFESDQPPELKATAAPETGTPASSATTAPAKNPIKNPVKAKNVKAKRVPKKDVKKKDAVKKPEMPAAVDPPTPPPPQPQTGELKLDVGLENYTGVSFLKPAFDIASYSKDQVLLPFADAHVLLRPSIKLSSGRAFSLHTRPFFEIRNQQSFYTSKKRMTKTEFSADLGESFVNLTISNRFSLTAGQENFQWGGAELSGPSNWIYRSTELAESISRNPQSRVKTRRTVRVNFSTGQSFNLVGIAEFEAEKRPLKSIFEGRRFLLKPEFSWNSGADYAGLVAGGAERQKFPFIGEYTSANLGEAMNVYLDAAHYKGSDLVRPQSIVIPAGPSSQRMTIFSQPDLNSDKWTHEVLLGLKYAFANGTDLRFEGYSHSAGYTLSEMTLVENLYNSESPLFPLFFAPAGETRAARSLFFSLRRNNFGKNKNWTALVRYWKPVSDSSGGAVVYADYGATDNATLYLAAGGFHGPLVSESSLTHRFAVTLGHKYVW